MPYDHRYTEHRQAMLMTLMRFVDACASRQLQLIEDVSTARRKWIEAASMIGGLLRPAQSILRGWMRPHNRDVLHHGYILLPDTDPSSGTIACLSMASQNSDGTKGPIEIGFHILLLDVDEVLRSSPAGLYYRIESPSQPGGDGAKSEHDYPHVQLSYFSGHEDPKIDNALFSIPGGGPTAPIPASCVLGLYLAALKSVYCRGYHERVSTPEQFAEQLSALDQYSL